MLRSIFRIANMKTAALTFCLLSLFPFVALVGSEEPTIKMDDESNKLKQTVKAIGLNKIIVRSVPPKTSSTEAKAKPYGLTRSELTKLTETIPTISRATSVRETISEVVCYRREDSVKHRFTLLGCTGEHMAESQLEIATGRFINQQDVQAKLTVCVLSKQVADKLFAHENPLGKYIFLPSAKTYVKVIGILKNKPTREKLGRLPATVYGQQLYIPLTTMRTKMGDTSILRTEKKFTVSNYQISQVTFTVKNVQDVEKTAKMIEAALLKDNPDRKDIAIIVPARLLK